jgi:hypothetical protein
MFEKNERKVKDGMRHASVLITCATLGSLGCGDAGTGPGPANDGSRLAAQFERLADSVDAGGYSPAATALRHAAEIVRLTGHATPATVTIDGAARSFLAVAEQIDFPDLQCRWPSDSGIAPPPPPSPPPDTLVEPPPPRPSGPPECTVVGTHSMRTLIAWEPENMAEVIRIVASVGSNGVARGVPDVMTRLPSSVSADPPSPPDSAPGGGGGASPGFMGEYLVRDVGSWWAVEGTQTNAQEDIAGSCTDDRATFDWAEFRCDAARLRFAFDMRVEPVRYDPPTGVADPPGGPEGSHTLALGVSSVDGVRLTVVAWRPPPLPPPPLPPPPQGPGPDPSDSTGTVGPP